MGLAYFLQPIRHLPESLEIFHFTTSSKCYQKHDHLAGNFNFDYLPPNLKELSISYIHTTSFDNLPSSLAKVALLAPHPISCDHLPPHITSLKIENNYDLNYLPSSILHLFIEGTFNQRLLKSLPPSLAVLIMSDFNDNLSLHCLPSSLIHLAIGYPMKGRR